MPTTDTPSAGQTNPPAAATGTLGILTPGLGAVATTFMAGVESVRRGLSQPIGSLTQMATIRLGKRTENRSPLIKDFVPLADLNDIVFGAWDPIPDDAYAAAKKAGVLEDRDIEPIAGFLKSIRPMPAVFGVRPVATRRCVPSSILADTFALRCTLTCLPDSPATAETRAPSSIAMPSS